MKTHFNPPEIWSPAGRAFSQGVVVDSGSTLFMTGQVAWDKNHTIVGVGDVRAQFKQCLENVAHLLTTVGGTFDDIVSLTIYFLRHEDLPVIQEVRAQYFQPQTAPVSILIQVPGLVAPEFLIELVPVAVLPIERRKHPPSH